MSKSIVDNGYFTNGKAWSIFYEKGNYTAGIWWDNDEENITYIKKGCYKDCLKKIKDLEFKILDELKGI